jgi:hypothetical protein
MVISENQHLKIAEYPVKRKKKKPGITKTKLWEALP